MGKLNLVGITIHCIFAYKQNNMKKNYTEQTTRLEIVSVAHELKVVLNEYQVQAVLHSFTDCRMQSLEQSNEEVISKIIFIILKEDEIIDGLKRIQKLEEELYSISLN